MKERRRWKIGLCCEFDLERKESEDKKEGKKRIDLCCEFVLKRKEKSKHKKIEMRWRTRMKEDRGGGGGVKERLGGEKSR